MAQKFDEIIKAQKRVYGSDTMKKIMGETNVAVAWVCLAKCIESMFYYQSKNDEENAIHAYKEGYHFFNELYPGLTPHDFSLFVVFSRTKRKDIEALLDDEDIPEELAEAIIFNLDKFQ